MIQGVGASARIGRVRFYRMDSIDAWTPSSPEFATAKAFGSRN